MNSVWFITERLAEIATILCSLLFLRRSLTAKVTKKREIIQSLSFCGVMLIAYQLVAFPIRPFVTLSLITLYASFTYEGERRIHFLWCVYALVIEGAIDAVVSLGYELISGIGNTVLDMPGWHRLAFIVISRLLLLGAYLAMTARAQRIGRLPWGGFILFISVPSASWVMLEVLFRYNALTTGLLVDAWLPFVGSIALVIIVIASTMFFHRVLSQERSLARADIQLRVTALTRDHIEQMNGAYKRISSMHHDVKHHFAVLSGLCRKGEYESVDSYVRTLVTHEEGSLLSSTYVGHPVLDVLLGARKEAARRSGIDFVHDIHLPQQMPISDVDLCIVFGNLLDNAFEAVAEMPAGANRFIRITARPARGYWAIACRNATRAHRSGPYTGAVPSTKHSEGVHGIGTQQISDIAERAGGYATYSHEDHTFSAVVMFRLPENGAVDVKGNEEVSIHGEALEA